MERLPTISFLGPTEEINRNLDELKKIFNKLADLTSFYRGQLEEIADAKGFDNIGNWAKNKAKAAIKKGKEI